MTAAQSLCRECLALSATAAPEQGEPRCADCGSPRVIVHPELHDLTTAHIDCDAFYAAVEKRDNPALADRPVIIGGGRRGVVAASCYVARMYGVRSAMPMFKAKEACPDAVVIRPNMAKYRKVGQQIRAMMRTVTPLVQPLSIDEAYMDLSAAPAPESPATRLARLILRIQREAGVSASVGLSYNKFLAKIASDLDKPKGFAVIGRCDAMDFLSPRPVSILWGVGKALESRLRRDGITTIGQLRDRDEAALVTRYGSIGSRLYRFARGEDDRKVDPSTVTKSISSETTFETNIADSATLKARLRPLCDTLAARLREKGFAGRTVTIKLKDAAFRLCTRSRQAGAPTQRADLLFEIASALIDQEADGRSFRLIGVGASDLTNAAEADPPDLFGGMLPDDAQAGQT
jgi:DNA polymerase-4